MRGVPTLGDLVNDPARVGEVPADQVAALRARLAEVDTRLLMRLMTTEDGRRDTSAAEQLLTVEQTAEKLNVSKDWVFRHQDRLGRVRLGRALRFRERHLDRYIRTRAGR